MSNSDYLFIIFAIYMAHDMSPRSRKFVGALFGILYLLYLIKEKL